jgi:hypothetical protein
MNTTSVPSPVIEKDRDDQATQPTQAPIVIDVSPMFADCDIKYPESYQFVDRQEIGGVA